MQSYAMGMLMFVQTMGPIMYGHLFMSERFGQAYHATMDESSGGEMDRYLETAIFLQISNSSAILILSARTGFFFLNHARLAVAFLDRPRTADCQRVDPFLCR